MKKNNSAKEKKLSQILASRQHISDIYKLLVFPNVNHHLRYTLCQGFNLKLNKLSIDLTINL
jgi:hypothetical protein